MIVSSCLRAAAVLAVSLAVLACASCSSSPAHAPAQPDLSGMPAQQLYQKALAALASADAVATSGTDGVVDESLLTFDLEFVGPNGSGTLNDGTSTWMAREIAGARYLKTDARFWSELGLSVFAPRYVGRWIEFPKGDYSLGGAGALFITSATGWVDRAQMSRMLLGPVMPTGEAIAETVYGVKCLRIASSTGSMLDVARTDARPIRFVDGGQGKGTVEFRYPSGPQPALVAPPRTEVVSNA